MPNVYQIRPEEFVDHGTLRSTAVFRLDPREISFELKHAHDDLDEYEVAYFTVDGSALVLQRYAGNPKHEYTVSVDLGILPPPIERARNVVASFIKGVSLPVSDIRWLN